MKLREEYSERKAKHRMDDALKRALNTPHRPHKSKIYATDSKVASKPRRKKGDGA